MMVQEEIAFIGVPDTERVKREIWELLLACDQDFLPPLSERVGSSQKRWEETPKKDAAEGPRAYFEEMIRQPFVILRKQGRLIGFMTFKMRDTSVEVPGYSSSNYATTLCIDPAYRGRHLAERLYAFLEEELPPQAAAPCLTLRTWSTNYAQLHILEKRGYICCRRLPNDRGKGVDTVYFYKIVGSHSERE